MMVGDDDVDAQASGMLDHMIRADAGIDAHNQPYAERGGLFHRVVLHAVTVANPVRDVAGGDAARQVQHFFEHDQRAGAVHIVVAIKQNGFFLFEGAGEARGRGRHAGQQKRIVQIGGGGP